MGWWRTEFTWRLNLLVTIRRMILSMVYLGVRKGLGMALDSLNGLAVSIQVATQRKSFLTHHINDLLRFCWFRYLQRDWGLQWRDIF
jgi:hypothetical protein